MTDRTIKVEKQTQLLLRRISGDLKVTGWDRSDIQLSGPGALDQLEEKSQQIILESVGDLALFIPHQLSVTAENVQGDASVSNLAGALEIHKVEGDLSLRDVGQTMLYHLAGDLFAAHIRGDLTVEVAEGDCMVKDVEGQFTGRGIEGDLLINDVAGGIEANTAGDLHANFSPVPWQAYALQAQGDIFAQIPPTTNADFIMTSDQESIQLNLNGQSQSIMEPKTEIELGEGGAQVTLSAGGEVILSTEIREWSPEFSFGAGLEGLSEQITQQTTEQIQTTLSSLESHLKENLSSASQSLEAAGFSEEKIAQIRSQIEQASQKATEKARQAAKKAEAKLERKIAQAQRKARRETRTFNLEDFLSQRDEERRAVSEKERMMILRMLQEKKITAQQADELLSALEGED